MNLAISKKKSFLRYEFFVLFILVPLGLFVVVPTPVLPFLWIVAFYCYLVLIKDKKFNKKNFLRQELVSKNIKIILLQFFGISAFIALFIAIFMPDMFFSLIKQNPILWLAVIILYPLLSV